MTLAGRRVWFTCLAGLLLLATAPLSAHEGPPFPIALDQAVGPYLVSIWADPDIGAALVYVVVDAADGESVGTITRVRVGVRPVSGRMPEAMYDTTSEAVRRGGRFVTEVTLDRQELWRIRAVIDGSRGHGEAAADVEATPSGTIGPIGLVVYALPFLLLGSVWVRVAIVRRRQGQEAARTE